MNFKTRRGASLDEAENFNRTENKKKHTVKELKRKRHKSSEVIPASQEDMVQCYITLIHIDYFNPH